MMKGSRPAAIVASEVRTRLFVFLFCITLAALAATPAPGALERTSGSVYVQYQNGNGAAGIRYRGNFIGHIGCGRIIASQNVIVSGGFVKKLDSGLFLYRGQNLGFRTPGTHIWRLRVNGRGIYASGFVRGCMTLNGVDTGPTGSFRIGQDGMLRAWPRLSRAYKLGWGC